MNLFVIIVLLIILVFLAMKRKRVTPGVIFALLWSALLIGAVLLNGFIKVMENGFIYIEICCIIFLISENLFSQKIKIVNKKDVNFINTVNICRVDAIANITIIMGIYLVIFAIIKNGFSFSSITAMMMASQEIYLANGNGSILTTLIVVAIFADLIMESYCFVGLKKNKNRYGLKLLLLFVLLVLYSLVTAKKSYMVWGVLLSFSGILIGINRFQPDQHFEKEYIKKNSAKLIRIAIAIVIIFVLMMELRGNYGFLKAFHSFGVYFFEEVDIFSIWFSHIDDVSLQMTHGRQLFYGFFDQIGMGDDLLGNWTQNSLALYYGFGSNIYTVFWTVIQDYGLPGSYCFWIITGGLSGMVYQIFEKRHLKQALIVMVFLYYFVLISFVTSAGHTLIAPLSILLFGVYLFFCENNMVFKWI